MQGRAQCNAPHVTSTGSAAGAGEARQEQRGGSQHLLGFEVRDPPLGAEMDVWLPAVGHFRKLSDEEKVEAGEAACSETGLWVGGGMISGRHAPLPGALPRLNVLHFA